MRAFVVAEAEQFIDFHRVFFRQVVAGERDVDADGVARFVSVRDGVGKSAVLRAMAQAGDVGEAVLSRFQHNVDGVAALYAGGQSVLFLLFRERQRQIAAAQHIKRVNRLQFQAQRDAFAQNALTAHHLHQGHSPLQGKNQGEQQ